MLQQIHKWDLFFWKKQNPAYGFCIMSTASPKDNDANFLKTKSKNEDFSPCKKSSWL